MLNQRDLVLMLEYDHSTGNLELLGYSESRKGVAQFSEHDVINVYMEQLVLYSILPDKDVEDVTKYIGMRYNEPEHTQFLQKYIPHTDLEVYQQELQEVSPDDRRITQQEGDFMQYLSKKYKPVALKVKPLYTDLSKKFRIKRDIKGDLFANMPELKPVSPEFKPTGQGMNGTIHRIAPRLLAA
jgi:hypothetical protein